MISNSSLQTELIGTKPGEKLYEELMSDEEMRRSVELKDYFSVMPAFRGMYREANYDYAGLVSASVQDPYHSGKQPVLSINEIRQYFRDNLIIEKLTTNEPNRYWPGDKRGKPNMKILILGGDGYLGWPTAMLCWAGSQCDRC